MINKNCTKCKKSFPETKENFSWRNDQQKFRAQCIGCEKERQRLYYLERGGREKSKKWEKENRVRRRELDRKREKSHKRQEWYEKRRLSKTEAQKEKDRLRRRDPKVRERSNELRREKRKQGSLCTFRNDLRSTITHSLNCLLQGGRVRTNTKSTRNLGCSIEEYKQHIESQFEDWMTWDNKGEWHIDHIIQLGSAKTIPDLLSLFHYTNTRPIAADKNLTRKQKRVEIT